MTNASPPPDTGIVELRKGSPEALAIRKSPFIHPVIAKKGMILMIPTKGEARSVEIRLPRFYIRKVY